MEVIIRRQPKLREGIVRVRDIPFEFETEEKFIAFWKELTARQRDRYSIAEFKNTITDGGLLAINNFFGNVTTIAGFAKYLALGTGALAGPDAGDTSLVNEVWRKAPGLTTIVGNTTDVTTYLTGTDAQVVITEAGLYTGSASGTLGSGTLATHLLFPLNNTGGIARSIDYLVPRG